MPKLEKRQQLFVDEYLIDLNATQAAIRAGYSPHTANEQGSRLLANVKVKNEIGKKMAVRSRRTGINQDRVLLEIAKIAFVNPIDVINMDEATVYNGADRDDTAAIASVKVKRIPTEEGCITEREVKIHDKLKALKMIGDHLNMWNKSENDETAEKITKLLADTLGGGE